jgi:putative transcriptional regulator
MADVRLGNRIGVARAKLRLSQEDLGKLAGVTRQTISSIENLQHSPSARLAFVIARHLGRSVTELFYIEGATS